MNDLCLQPHRHKIRTPFHIWLLSCQSASLTDFGAISVKNVNRKKKGGPHERGTSSFHCRLSTSISSSPSLPTRRRLVRSSWTRTLGRVSDIDTQQSRRLLVAWGQTRMKRIASSTSASACSTRGLEQEIFSWRASHVRLTVGPDPHDSHLAGRSTDRRRQRENPLLAGSLAKKGSLRRDEKKKKKTGAPDEHPADPCFGSRKRSR